MQRTNLVSILFSAAAKEQMNALLIANLKIVIEFKAFAVPETIEIFLA